MLFGEGQTNDRDRQDQPVNQVRDRDFPAEEYGPQDVEDHFAKITSFIGDFNFLAKWAIVAIPSLMASWPNGIPTIVKQTSNPPRIYPSPERKPPKINQIIFPKQLI